ncbi:MAG: phosphate signaling complex protein PhoU [Anaerolineae bacterium]
MPRQALDRELQRLIDEVLVLASMVEQALCESVQALKARDREAARRIIAGDRQINERRFAIEADCLAVIAMQQPAASDLRVLAALLEVATELERIGDYGKGIARISLQMGDEPLIKPLIDIPRMADRARTMLRQSLVAFVRRDAETARAIPLEDDEVDALYNQVYQELLTYIMADPRNTNQATLLLWVAHNLERAADRVTNICERIVFMVTGEMNELDVTDGITDTLKNVGVR